MFITEVESYLLREAGFSSIKILQFYEALNLDIRTVADSYVVKDWYVNYRYNLVQGISKAIIYNCVDTKDKMLYLITTLAPTYIEENNRVEARLSFAVELNK